MLVNILQTFDWGPRRFFAGENPDVAEDVARRWIADGKASADTDGVAQSPLVAALNGGDQAGLAAVRGAVGQFGKKRIAVGVIGQSNERGQVQQSDKATYPACFASQVKPGNAVPIGPSVSALGGIWPRLADLMYPYGYDLNFVNGAIGSMSMIRQAAGWGEFWNANQASTTTNPIARNRRTPAVFGDFGDGGTVMVRGVSGGKTGVFYCSAGGANVYTSYSSAIPVPASSPTVYNLDYMYTPAAGGTGAGADPFAAYAGGVGGTVTDGALTWTCVNADVAGASDAAFTSLAQGTVLQDGKFGFDPLGILRRLHTEMQRHTDVDEKWIIIQNAQSDEFAGAAVTWYQQALTNVANYFLSRGYKVWVGLSCYDASGSNVTAYGYLQTQWQAAITALQAGANGANVYTGANLFAALGTTPGAGGLYLQGDNLHLTGQGAYAAADAWNTAMRAAVPQRT